MSSGALHLFTHFIDCLHSSPPNNWFIYSPLRGIAKRLEHFFGSTAPHFSRVFHGVRGIKNERSIISRGNPGALSNFFVTLFQPNTSG